jgi:hypothetical protein
MTLESDLKRYEYAMLGQHFAQKGENEYLEGAVNSLRGSLHEDAAPAIDLLLENEAIEPLLGIYAGKYLEVLKSAKVEELAGLYGNSLHSLLSEEEAEKIYGLFRKYGGETYGNILSKVGKANYILEGKKKGLADFSEDEIEEAKATLEQYREIFSALSQLEKLKFETLRPKATTESTKGKLEKIVKGL